MSSTSPPAVLLSNARFLARNTRQVIQKIGNLSQKKQLSKSAAADVIYEAYVNMRALQDIAKTFVLRLHNTTGKRWVCLPLSPADKANHPYFIACDANGNDVFQVCMGTKIFFTTGSGSTHAPDLSIQKPNAGNQPNGTDVWFWMDAKYSKHGNTRRLARTEVATASAFTKLIQPSWSLPTSPFQAGSLWRTHTTVVTNAKHSSLSDSDRRRLQVSEVAEFYPNSVPSTRP